MLKGFCKDASRFVACFYTPISKSVLYLSALPFSPEESKIAMHFRPLFPQTLSVTTGLGDRWPAILNIFEGHTNSVMSAAFSPDGTLVVSGSADKTVCIRSAETGQVLRIFDGHTECVTSVAFSPDGKHVVSGSDDRTVRVWNVEASGTMFSTLTGHTLAVNSVAFSPDGQYIISGSDDTTIRIWIAVTRDPAVPAFDTICADHAITSVAFSPDGILVVGGLDNETLCIWNRGIRKVSLSMGCHAGAVVSVAFSPDGTHVVSGSVNRICIWDVVTATRRPVTFEGQIPPNIKAPMHKSKQFCFDS